MTLEAHIGVDWPSLTLEVDIRLQKGSVLAIMGPNGAGKSTVLRALAGLLPVQRGRISLSNRLWDDPDSRAFVPARQRNVGLVFQDHLLFRHLTVLGNVAFGPRARGLSKTAARAEASACLERLGLSDLGPVFPAQLSGGQSQRVALARALVNRPELLLLDEPLAALDVVTRRHIRTEIARDLADHRPTTILVTHDSHDALTLADDVLIIENGRAVQHGPVREVADSPATSYVAALFEQTP